MIKIKDKILNSTSLEQNLEKIDLVILTTDHDVYDYKKIYNRFNKIIDTRGRFYNFDNTKIVHA